MTIVVAAIKSESSAPIINRYEYNTFGDGDLASLKRLALAMFPSDHEIRIYGESVDGSTFHLSTKPRGKFRFKNA